ncbi:hypothetical protein Taro_004212 [Colocasia esculenta]|uniref:Large ribosomal subunit protein uL30 N-terminal eukaryotes domain-containing protein n=1 Tax=Colocasia esculenta TaxID=4460 RepID=A0A843TLI2_COLES|nr:hypothetical protein [Colocasia esculenta]
MMASEEAQPLTYVPETILKKRKGNEQWALKKKEHLEARKKIKKDRLKNIIKRPEQFVKEYRDKVKTCNLTLMFKFSGFAKNLVMMCYQPKINI